MQVRKQVLENIRKMLEEKQNSLRWKIQDNKRKLHDLVREQSIAKRELGELQKLIRGVSK